MLHDTNSGYRIDYSAEKFNESILRAKETTLIEKKSSYQKTKFISKRKDLDYGMN